MKTEKNAVGQLRKAYNSLAWMNLTAHLYNMTESVRDGRFGMEGGGLGRELDGIYGDLLTAIRDWFTGGKNATQSILSRVGALRERILERSEQVQVYNDALSIYEFLFNRAEFSFRSYDKPFDDEEEARELLRLIFAAKDAAEVNLRIQMMVSQLPVRLTRQRFFDLIRESFTVYGNSDTEAVNGFRYRLVSAAAVKERPDEQAFVEYKRLTDALSKVDTETVSEEECKEWQERIEDTASALNADADYLLDLAECINAFYTTVLLDDDADEETKALMLPAVGSIAEFGMALLMGRNDELKEGPLGPAFAYMEGRLEPLSERVLKDEAKIDAYCENDPAWAASEEGKTILLSKKLMSTSKFAPLTDVDNTPATKEIIEDVTREVLTVLEKGMEGRPRSYNRAVMASVLKELPVFFNSHTEVMNYVLHSLRNCRNEGEKRGATEMLRELLLPSKE